MTRAMLEQGEDYKADIYFLMLIGTQDEKWVGKALKNFDKTKVRHERFINLKNSSIDDSQ